MTQNQISFAVAEENKRHNLAQEQLSKEQNAITAKMNAETAKHYARQDDINKAHYERSDTASMLGAQASMTSANASALNAQTNQAKYRMEYDIEYGWTGSEGYPEGMPLSAQRKNFELTRDVQLAEYEYKEKEANIAQKQASALNLVLNAFAGKGGVWGVIQDVLGNDSSTSYIGSQQQAGIGVNSYALVPLDQ